MLGVYGVSKANSPIHLDEPAKALRSLIAINVFPFALATLPSLLSPQTKISPKY